MSSKQKKLLYLGIVLQLLGGSFGIDDKIRDVIPAMLEILCPHSDVCRPDTSLFEPEEDSCCTDCSCEADCGETNNCCYPDDSQWKSNVTHKPDTDFKVVQDGKISTEELSSMSECLYPFSRQPSEVREKLKYNSLWIVTEGTYKKTNMLVKCGDINVAHWGSIWPVTSNSTGIVYKNIHCAQEHNVTDALYWTAVLMCDRSSNMNIEWDGLTDGKFPAHCKIHFKAPRLRHVSQFKVCFTDLIDTCPKDYHQSDAKLGEMTTTDIVQACTSGLVSPYRNKKLYANVFCHICNGEWFDHSIKCTVLSHEDMSQRINKYGFTALISPSSFAGWTDDTHNKKDVWNVCPSESANIYPGCNTCRNVLCPFGQLRTPNGQCVQVASDWLQTGVGINVRLVSKEPFKILLKSDTHATVYRYTDISNLSSPWPRQWFISSVFYNKVEPIYGNYTNTNELVVFIVNKLSEKNPFKILRIIDKFIKMPWVWNTNGKTVHLKSDYFDFIDTDLAASSQTIAELSNTTLVRLYLAETLVPKNSMFISKPFFCEQIRLSDSEFTLSGDHLSIYNNVTGRNIFNADFKLVTVESRVEARVCLEDSGFQRSKPSSADSLRASEIAKLSIIAFIFRFAII